METAQSRYQRHTTISQYGINDSDVRDVVEWQYDRAMANLPKKDRVDLGQWLESIKLDPTKAPSTLRPFFEPQVETTQVETSTATQAIQPPPSQPVTQAIQPPPSNRGVQTPSTTAPNDILSRASDPSFYAQNREAIREAYYSRLGQTPRKF